MPRDFRSLPLRDLLDDVAAAEPAPGSGAVAAIVVAHAAALLAGAARASRDGWADAGGAVAQAAMLRTRALELAGDVSDAYVRALGVLDSPPGTTSDERDAAIAEALVRAAEVPLDIARAAADTAALGSDIAERGSPATQGDVGAAVLLAEGAAYAAASLVGINLTAAPNDPRIARAAALAEDATIAARRALGDRWHSLH